MASSSSFSGKLFVFLALIIFTAVFVLADEQQIQVEDLGSVASDDASLRIELDNLNSKIRELEPLVEEKTHELRSKDDVIGEKEKIIHENLDTIALLQSEIASLKEKGMLDADEKLGQVYTRADELEKQVDHLKKKIEAKDKEAEALNSQNEEIKTKILELNSKLESLQETIEKQKVQFHKTERALRHAEEELINAKSEATSRTKALLEVHGAWLPPWIEAHLIHYQALVEKHWQQHGKPVLRNTLDKAAEKKSQALKWTKPHIETIRTQWIPVAKEQCIVFVESIKPHLHSLNAKTDEIYEITKITLTPHIIKAQEIVDPYYKEVKKFSKPYIEQVATVAKPHVEKVRGSLKPYTEKAIQSYEGLLKSASIYHQQVQTIVQEKLQEHELTSSLATKEFVWFAASALLALPIIILLRVCSAVLCKKTKKVGGKSHASHARRRAKRGHSDK
ncbi:uncharacterized protein LOC124931032 [Impatiens glandulifera]|uniref:uncharacterized protein LOC124931032 n=1 Tax=Impatiens glandulifera TaxID=253017 RepID=UPI001FB10962|nr:uncharacterized protein LOC124931032 [Impatiens glandulifera]XP_047327376.1 uncharacterized protein LOC124931032 [Impatiens glandulifera]